MAPEAAQLESAPRGTQGGRNDQRKGQKTFMVWQNANLMTAATIAAIPVPMPWPNAALPDFSCIGEKIMIVTAAKTTACSPLDHSVTIQNRTVAPTPKNTRKAFTRAGR